MGDACVKAAVRSAGLEIAVARTTDLARAAKEAHALAPTSLIALGRLLTAAALIGQTSKRKGGTSLQIISKARMKQLFADVTHEGNLRGMVKNASLSFPFTPEEARGRRPIAAAIMPGKLSVVRSGEDGAFTQSTTDLVSGEVDLDVEYFLEQSDQIPTALAADVLFGDESEIEVAGGALVMGLPGADLSRLEDLRARLRGDGLSTLLRAHHADPEAILRALAPDARMTDPPAALAWKCRCSYSRVLDALKMLRADELAEIVGEAQDVKVSCDLCGARYTVARGDVQQVFSSTIKAQS